MQTITKPDCQQALFETRFDRKIKTSTNSRSVQCFDFLSSFRFIYFPHRLVNYTFMYNLVTTDFNKIHICRRINARSCVKRVLEATLNTSNDPSSNHSHTTAPKSYMESLCTHPSPGSLVIYPDKRRSKRLKKNTVEMPGGSVTQRMYTVR